MDNKNDSYFYLGGAISTSMLLSVFALFSYALFSMKSAKSYALTKDTSINISLVSDTQKKDIEKKITDETPMVKTEESKEKETSVTKNDTPSKQEDVSSLFSNVSTKSAEIKKSDKVAKIDENKLLKLTKKVDTVSKNDVVSLKQKIDNTKFSKADVKVTSQSSSTGAEVNKYLAKIQGQIYDNFFPPSNTQGQIAKVLIKLSVDGRVMDFRILSYSGNEFLNAEVDRLKIRVLNLRFPQNPDRKSGDYIITLVAKE